MIFPTLHFCIFDKEQEKIRDLHYYQSVYFKNNESRKINGKNSDRLILVIEIEHVISVNKTSRCAPYTISKKFFFLFYRDRLWIVFWKFSHQFSCIANSQFIICGQTLVISPVISIVERTQECHTNDEKIALWKERQ